MKKLLFIALVLILACGKEDNEPEKEAVTKVEYWVKSSVEGAMIKYIDSKGQNAIDFVNDEKEWSHSFKPEVQLDSVGFQVKDYITWVEYKIIVNDVTVVDYEGTLPEGGYAGWVGIFYKP